MSENRRDAPPWRAAYTRARHEKKVAGALEERGFDVYLPLVERESQWHDRKKRVEWPMFAGYVFVRLDASSSAAVLSVPGVASLVGAGGGLAEIPENDIANVRSLEAAISSTGALPEVEPMLETGEQVRVTAGPFTGIEGVVLQTRGGRAVVQVGVRSISQAVRLDLAASDVVSVEAGADR